MQNWQPIRHAAFVPASASSLWSVALLRSWKNSNMP